MSDLHGLTARHFMEQFPFVLKDGGAVEALGETIAAALERRYRETIEACLYPRIDELSESVLDLLADELQTPFYNLSFSVEAKRQLIKETLLYYKMIGTVGACNRMLRAVFPGSYLEEWWDYDGDPVCFRLIVELSRSKGHADAQEIRDAIYKTKREAAHLEMIIFQWNVGITIRTSEKGYLYRAPMTGTLDCGTWPHRSTEGRLIGSALETETAAAGYLYQTGMTGQTITGTRPRRDTEFAFQDEVLITSAAAEPFRYEVPPTGTVPERSEAGGIMSGNLEARTAAEPFRYEATPTGTVPRRDTEGGIPQVNLTATGTAEGFLYEAALTGTAPQRDMEGQMERQSLKAETSGSAHPYQSPTTGTRTARRPGGIGDTDIQASANSAAYPYKTAPSGTRTERREAGQSGAFSTTAEGTGFHYKVKPCGTSNKL